MKFLAFAFISLVLVSICTTCAPAATPVLDNKTTPTFQPPATQPAKSPTKPAATETQPASPTPEAPVQNEQWYGLGDGNLDHFPLVDKAKIFTEIIPRLMRLKSLLDPNALAVHATLTESATEKNLVIPCNYDGTNCAVAAHFKVMDQGKERDMLVWEIKISETESVYRATYFHDDSEITGIKHWERLIKDPMGSRDIILLLVQSDSAARANKPYSTYLQEQQEGIDSVVTALTDNDGGTSVKLEDFDRLIVPAVW